MASPHIALAPTQPTLATHPVSGSPLDPVEEPRLRIWASYPEGSWPESVEVTFNSTEEITADLIAGILRSLPTTVTLTEKGNLR